MKKYTCCLAFLCFISVALAQEDSTRFFPDFKEKPSLNFKFAPLCLFEPIYNTIEGAVEYKFHPNISAQAQFGYGNSNLSPYNPTGYDSPYRTYRSRIEVRYYMTKPSLYYRRIMRIYAGQPSSESIRNYFLNTEKQKCPYLAIELTWKNTVFFEEGYVGVDCSGGACNYQKYTTYQRNKNVGILSFKIGKQRFYGSRFFLDYYTGLELRFVDIHVPHLNSGFVIEDAFFDRIDARSLGSFVMPGISAGIKLGFSLPLGHKNN